jgi:hypothetical protein
VSGQETEETQPYAPRAGASSQVWEQRGRKKKILESHYQNLQTGSVVQMTVCDHFTKTVLLEGFKIIKNTAFLASVLFYFMGIRPLVPCKP